MTRRKLRTLDWMAVGSTACTALYAIESMDLRRLALVCFVWAALLRTRDWLDDREEAVRADSPHPDREREP